MTWISDDRGNKCSVEYFGSKVAAQKALDSLKNCDNCSNCSRCSGCSNCSDCDNCSDCSDCSRCSGCSGCSNCSDCDNCSDCSNCSRCSDCSRCSGCSGCSRCSDCSDCSRCSGLQGMAPGVKGPPSVPKIPDLDAAVYAAASQPEALVMNNWHTCEKKHCRAGWIVALAGPEGRALESFFNIELAAMLIYHSSTGRKIHPARFFDSDEDALADMRKLAESDTKEKELDEKGPQ